MTMLASLLASLCFILSNARNSGKYHDFYNQSEFTWGGSAGECTLQASYSTGGPGWSGSNLCDAQYSDYESQQEFDLEYYELLKVCPYLLKVPEADRGSVKNPTGKYRLPEDLVWHDWACRTAPADTLRSIPWSYTGGQGQYGIDYCPRWRCDNSSALWNSEFNETFTYNEITTLSFSTTPLSSTCFVCRCADWGAASSPPGQQWVWTCDYSVLANDYNGRKYGPINPIDELENYERRDCRSPTLSPTPDPTDGTLAPTDSPTPAAVAPCDHAWGSTSPGSYYWDAVSSTDCSTLSFCYCHPNGVGTCESTWDDIMNDDLLYPGFLYMCGGTWYGNDWLTECWQPSMAGRLFSWYNWTATNCWYSPGDALCPRCGCTETPETQSSRTNTSFDTITFQDIRNTVNNTNPDNYVYEYNCANCSCVLEPEDANSRGMVSYVWDCDNYDTINNDDSVWSNDCFKETRQCMSMNGESYYDADAAPTYCSDQRTDWDDFDSYCSFSRITYEDSHPGDVCVEQYLEFEGSWGCGPSHRCDLLGGAGCYKADFSYPVTAYDCMESKWKGDTYKANMLYSCCDDAFNCNNRTIEDYLEGEDECETADGMKEYQVFTLSCQLSQHNLYQITDDENLIRAAFCDDTLSYEEYEKTESTQSYCELLKVYWQHNTFCDCNAARLQIGYINEVGLKDGDLMVRYRKNDFWSSSRRDDRNRLKAMYEYWSCAENEDDGVSIADTFFDCDFDAEAEEIQNQNVVDAASSIFSYFSCIIVLISALFTTRDRCMAILLLTVCSCIMHARGAADYDWYHNGGEYEDCEFVGYVGTDNDDVCEQVYYQEREYQNEDLTWAVLRESCEDLEYAGCWTKDKQLSMDELVWPKDGMKIGDRGCWECPRCPCSNATDTIRHYVENEYNLNPIDNTFMRKRCYQCTCSYWDYAEEWAWTCTNIANKSPPYALNETEIEFCPYTPNPTMAPTQDQDLYCMEGYDDFDSLNENAGDGMYGSGGISHCAWFNLTRERYEDGEPAVCVSDEVEPAAGWFPSGNTRGLCLAVAGEDTGCYYADFDLKVQAFDCARDQWITDEYAVGATMFCCNDGYYCNNQTMVNGQNGGAEVEYFSYENVTETVQCKKSSKLQEYLSIVWGCDYKDHGFGDDYIRAMQCNGGETDSEVGCEELKKYWRYWSKCTCEQALFFRNNVNSTYTPFVDDWFEMVVDSVAQDLAVWAYTLECSYSGMTQWYCSGVKTCQWSIFVLIFIAVSHSFF